MCTDKEVSIEKMKTGIKYNLDNTCMNYKLYICGSSGKLTWLYRDIAYIRNTTYMKTPYYAPDDFFLIRIKGQVNLCNKTQSAMLQTYYYVEYIVQRGKQ